MALTKKQEPSIVQPVNNPIPIVYSSDSATTSGFRYKLELTNTGGTTEVTVWIYPDINNSYWMIYDAGLIYQSYVDTDKYWDATGSTYSVNDMYRYKYTVTEYIGDESGSTSGSTDYKYIFNGVKQYGDFWDKDDYICAESNTGVFLSTWVGDRNYKQGEYGTINTIHADDVADLWTHMRIKRYINTSLQTQLYIHSGTTTDYRITTLPIGPQNLEDSTGIYDVDGNNYSGETIIPDTLTEYKIDLVYLEDLSCGNWTTETATWGIGEIKFSGDTIDNLINIKIAWTDNDANDATACLSGLTTKTYIKLKERYLGNEWFVVRYGSKTEDTTGITLTNITYYSKSSDMSWSGFTLGDEVNLIYQDDLVNYGTSVSNEYNIKLDTDCYKHDGVQFMWLGDLGTYETFTFRMADIKSFKTKREEIKKQLYNMDGNNYTYSIGDRGRSVIYVKTSENHIAMSNWLDDDMSTNLMELYRSKDVYIIKDNNIYPIIIESNGVVEKTINNNILFNHTIDYTMAYQKLTNL